MSAATRVGVVGGGIVGLSTAYALSQRGARVTVFDPSPGDGQSAGESRIFRHQHEDDWLIGFARRARGLWTEWGERLGRSFVAAGGSLLAGDGALVRSRAEGLARFGIDHAILDRPEQAAAFPGFGWAGNLALLDREGGAIRAAEAIAALRAQVGEGLIRERVAGCFEEGGHAIVVTGASIEEFDRVVIAAGDETPALAARVGIEIRAANAWHTRLAFPPRAGVGLPGVCLQDRSGVFGERVYGTPEPGHGAFAIGLAGQGIDLPVAPGGLIEGPAGLRPIANRLGDYVRQALPGLSPEPRGYRICRSTSLPGGPDDFSLWREGPFIAAAGGNLFKMAPALGVALADVALGGEIPDLRDESPA